MTDTSTQKIILGVEWHGPIKWGGGWEKGGYELKVVDLLFQGAKTQISVHLDDGKTSKLHFTCNRMGSMTYPEQLRVTAEQIENLVLKVGVFDKSEKTFGHRVLDPYTGKITPPQHMARRRDEKVKLQRPDKLEMDAEYHLVMTADDILQVTAKLVKVEKSTKVDTTDLEQVLSANFLPAMQMKLTELTLRAPNAPMRAHGTDTTTPGKQAIKEAIQKIDKSTLATLAPKFKGLQQKLMYLPLAEKNKLEKEVFGLLFNALGEKGVEKLLRSYLNSFLTGAASSDTQKVIDSLCTRFRESVFSQLQKPDTYNPQEQLLQMFSQFMKT